MFLSKLKSEEMELFLDLGIHLASCDGDFALVEKENIIQMCQEMGIEKRLDAKLSFNEALEQLSKLSNNYEKKIILLELAGIVMADGVCSPEEKELLMNIITTLNMKDSDCDAVIKLVSSLYSVYSEIGNYLASK